LTVRKVLPGELDAPNQLVTVRFPPLFIVILALEPVPVAYEKIAVLSVPLAMVRLPEPPAPKPRVKFPVFVQLPPFKVTLPGEPSPTRAVVEFSELPPSMVTLPDSSSKPTLTVVPFAVAPSKVIAAKPGSELARRMGRTQCSGRERRRSEDANERRSAVGGELTTEDTESTEKKQGICIMFFMKMIEIVS
jgi:hypothetical protein